MELYKRLRLSLNNSYDEFQSLYRSSNQTSLNGSFLLSCIKGELTRAMLDQGYETTSTFPLENACRCEKLDIVTLLIERDFPLDRKLLIIACKKNNVEMLELLLRSGCNPDSFQVFHNALLTRNPELIISLFNAYPEGSKYIQYNYIEETISYFINYGCQNTLCETLENMREDMREILLGKIGNVPRKNRAMY